MPPFFRFEGQYYRQVFGTAMGSPLSPILADIALDTVIDKAMSSLPFPIPILKKYVDDIFMAIPVDAKERKDGTTEKVRKFDES